MSALAPIFEHRIVKTDTGEFMPQRGVAEELVDFTVARLRWRDAIPQAAPTVELARLYLDSIRKFDTRCTAGEVVS
jgi:hypothetical protein